MKFQRQLGSFSTVIQFSLRNCVMNGTKVKLNVSNRYQQHKMFLKLQRRSFFTVISYIPQSDAPVFFPNYTSYKRKLCMNHDPLGETTLGKLLSSLFRKLGIRGSEELVRHILNCHNPPKEYIVDRTKETSLLVSCLWKNNFFVFQ